MSNWNLLRKFIGYPPFKRFDNDMLPHGLVTQMLSPYYYTPLIQLKEPSEEFQAKMRVLSRKKKITFDDQRALVHDIIEEYVNISNRENNKQNQLNDYCSYYKNYVCEGKPYGGVVDYLVFCNNYKNFVPILYFPRYGLNLPGAVAASIWNLNSKPESNYGFAIHTDGNVWQMVRISRRMELEKTIIYEAQNLFRNYYQDAYFRRLIFGLINEGLQQQKIQRKALRNVYDYVDEKRYSIEAKPGEKIHEPLVTRIIKWFIK